MSTVLANTITAVGGGGATLKMANDATYVSDGGAVTQNTVQGLAKAWFHIVNGGAGSIALGDSFNSSVITDGGTGIYNFSISNDMSNAVYSLNVSIQAGAGFPDKPHINSQSAGSFQARSAHASDEVDSGIYNATVHGDLA